MKTRLQSAMLALGMGCATLLSGCATIQQESRLDKATVNAGYDRIEAISHPELPNRSFSVNNGFYAARKPLETVPVNAHQDLPPNFFQEASMNDQRPVLLTEIAARITSRLGYVVSIDQDVLMSHQQQGGSGAGAFAVNSAGATPGTQPEVLPPLPDSAGAASPGIAGAGLRSGGSMQNQVSPILLPEFIYTGTLAGLLDTLTGKLDLSWRWTGQRVEIFRFETKMFRLDALAGQVSSNANLKTGSSTTGGGNSGGGSGGSSGGGSTVSTSGSSGQTVNVAYEMTVWTEVEKSLKAIASKDGTLSMSPSLGIITARDTPQTLNQMEAMVAEFNRLYDRQVTLNVEVYSIELNSAQDYGIDWNLVYKQAARNGLSLSSLSGLGGNGGSSQGQVATLTHTGGSLGGSSVMLQALSTIGRTTLMTSNTIVAMNGQSVPINVAREQTYLASYSTTLNGSASGGQTTTLTPGVVSDGVAMSFTPRILEDNDVILRYAIDLSTTDAITDFVSPDGLASIQLPRQSVRNFLQNVKVHSGDTLVLSGFQQVQGSSDGQGPGTPKLWFLGGKRNASTLARTLVVVVTPYVNGP